MEVNADNFRNDIVPHCKSDCTCLTNKNMNELNVSLLEAANYLIQLFYQTDKKYSCTRTKVGKLLSIVAFVYAKKGEKLFAETIYRFDTCGTAINELKFFVDRDVYIQYQYCDDCKYIHDELKHSEDVLEKHKKIDTIDNELKIVIEDVFRRFGSFPAYDLGQCINPIVNLPQMTNENNEIQLNKIQSIKLSDFSDNVLSEKNDSLVKYLFNNGGVNGSTTE